MKRIILSCLSKRALYIEKRRVNRILDIGTTQCEVGPGVLNVFERGNCERRVTRL